MSTIAEQFAHDWFTIAPAGRTKERLAKHIQEAIDAFVDGPAISDNGNLSQEELDDNDAYCTEVDGDEDCHEMD